MLDGGGLFGDRNVRTVVKEPVGVVGAITPSNFPIEVILNKLGPALATGNTVILKPDPHTPWNATRLGRLIAEHTDIPAGVLNVVPTPANDVAELLATDPRVDMISFTGSTAVGKLLIRQGAETMKRTFLELGGKSALIVTEDVDPPKIMASAVGVCVHAGQACALTTRMLVHRSLFDDAVDSVTAAFGMVPVGDPALPQTLVGPVISATQKDRVLDACERARRDGAEITIGGGAFDDLPADLAGGFYVAADGRGRGRQLRGDRAGGDLRPGLVMLPFDDDDEAVRIANDSAFGLAGAVLSGRPSAAWPSRAASGPVRSVSTAACSTAPTRRSVATRTAASAGSAASRDFSSISRPRPSAAGCPGEGASGASKVTGRTFGDRNG